MVLSCNAQIFELREQRADQFVVFDHAGPDHVLFGTALVHRHLDVFLRGARTDVNRRRVVPDEEWLIALADLVQVFQRFVGHLPVDGLHALARQRADVLDLLLADATPFGLLRRVLHVRRPGMEHAARRIHLGEFGGGIGRTQLRIDLPRIVELFRLLFRVQVVEVAIPFVEPVHGGQELIAVAQVVLTELSCRVALRLEDFGERRIGFLNPALGARNADGCHARADGELPHNECRAPGGATGLAVLIGEQHAIMSNAIEVRGAPHHAVRIGTDIPHADVVAPDDENVGFLVLRHRRHGKEHQHTSEHGGAKIFIVSGLQCRFLESLFHLLDGGRHPSAVENRLIWPVRTQEQRERAARRRQPVAFLVGAG